jgi:anthranilate synthase component 1
MEEFMKTDALIRMIPGEEYTPYSLARKLNAIVLLESSSLKKGRERYSLLLIREAFRLTQVNKDIFLKRPAETKKFKVLSKAKDILDLAQYFANQHKAIAQDFPYPAGGIGYLSYEFARFCDKINFHEQTDPLQLPDASFLFGHVFIVFDHYTDLLILIGLNYKEAEIDLNLALEELENSLSKPGREQDSDANSLVQTNIVSEKSREAVFLETVAEIRHEIISGNLLQAVPSRRLEVKSELEAIEAYRFLRRNNPSPYLFYIDFTDYQLFGASPETHVRVKNGIALMHPIAGTRKRGTDQHQDNALEEDLLADPKEQAEHLMLVDLARNDLGRVCKPGTVMVNSFMNVERYSHVMHLVSEVQGELAQRFNGVDALRATFPAGTVSGAPKIRAIEILSKHEPFQRRFYAGALGYLEPGGSLDTCIMIRCALKIKDRFILQAGAGVVYDSTPERELAETSEKLAAMCASINLEQGEE